MPKRILIRYFSVLFSLVISAMTSQVHAQSSCSQVFNESANSTDILTLKNYAQQYSEIIPPVNDMISIGLERYSNKKPKGYCYRAVKSLLIDSGLVKRNIDGTFASSAHTKDFLVNRGFINLMERGPFNKEIKGALDENIPVGAILVFAGTNGVDGGVRPLGQGIGHIEIKCGPNCYLFDTVNQFPGGKNQFTEPGVMEAGSGAEQRRLIGVYILDFFSIF